MENRILEIVVLLIDYFRDNPDYYFNIDDLSSNLKARGYTDTEISSAYSWLMERYDHAPEKNFSDFPKVTSPGRILTDIERRTLTIEAQGFMHKLLSFSLIDNEQFELIIDRASLVASGPIDIEHIKLIASSVIFRDVDELDNMTMVEPKDSPSSFLN